MARAAATGGGRTYRGQRPVGWYAIMAVIVVLGVASIAYSKYELVTAKDVPPTLQDHWYAAYAFDICGTIQPSLPQNPNINATKYPPGIKTHGNGVIDIHPISSVDTGHNATFGRFVLDYPGLVVTGNEIHIPGKRVWRNGDMCGKGRNAKPGEVIYETWPNYLSKQGTFVVGNPDSIRLENGQLITVAFVPAGTKIPKPPKANIQAMLSGSSAAPSSAPTSGSVPVTPAPSGSVPVTPAPTSGSSSSSK